MHEPEKLDRLLEQMAGADIEPPAALQQAVRKRIRRRHQLVRWMVILSLVLNAILFVGLLVAPWVPGLTLTGRVLIWVVESLTASFVIVMLLAARDPIGSLLTRLELLITTS